MARRLTARQLRFLFATVFKKARENPEAAVAIGASALGAAKFSVDTVRRNKRVGQSKSRLTNTVVQSEQRRLKRRLTKKEVKTIRKSVNRDFNKFLAPDIRRRAKLNSTDLSTQGNRKKKNLQRVSTSNKKKAKRKLKRSLLGN